MKRTVCSMLILMGILIACGAPPVASITSVSVTADLTTVNAASPVTLTATVLGTEAFNAAVTWSITSGGGTLSATTGSSVTFTSPSLAASSTTMISVTSVADSSKSASITITTNAVDVTATITSVVVTADLTTVNAASPALLTATVVGTGAFSNAVNWAIASGGGTLSATTGANITFTAPSRLTASSTIITVTSVPDSSKTASITINTNASTFGSTITEINIEAPTVVLSDRTSFNRADLTATVLGTGNFNPAVKWSLAANETGILANNTSALTRYTPPSTGSRLGRVVPITVTSVQDPNIKRTIFIGINSGRASVSGGLDTSINGDNTHALAITTNAGVASWGTEAAGELCSGGGSQNTVESPGVFSNNGGLASGGAVAAGGLHSLVLEGDGEISSCGANDNGQLGVGAFNQTQVSRTSIVEAVKFSAIAAGGKHSMALIAQGSPVGSSGTVMTWGSDLNGQLGNGGANSNELRPTIVSNLAGVSAIAAGKDFSLALTSTGDVFWWGQRPGTNTTSNIPVRLDNTGKIIAITAGENHVLAINTNGKLLAWGSDATGQLGNGGGNATLLSPIFVDTLENVVAIAAGSNHSLAITADNKVYAWGSDSDGQLGDGNGFNSNRNSPTLLANRTFVTVAAGKNHSFGTLPSGQLLSWGSDEFAQLGNGATTGNQDSPVNVLFGTSLINLP